MNNITSSVRKFLNLIVVFLSRKNTRRILLAIISSIFLCFSVFIYKSDLRDSNYVSQLLITDLLLLSTMLYLLLYEYIHTFICGGGNMSSYKLRKNIILFFSVVVSAPIILASVLLLLFLNYGVKYWVDEKISKTLYDSLEVAQVYLREYERSMSNDIRLVAHNIESGVFYLRGNKEERDRLLQKELSDHGFHWGALFDKDLLLIGTNDTALNQYFKLIPEKAFKDSEKGEVIFLTNSEDGILRCMIKLDSFLIDNIYLVAGRVVDYKVLHHIKNAKDATEEYRDQQLQIYNLQINISFLFMITAIILIILAVMCGLFLVKSVTYPIGKLVNALEQIKAGNLDVCVLEAGEDDEISILQRGFNQMVDELKKQKHLYVLANEEIQSKNLFNEQVISNISSGVVVLDNKFLVKIINSASQDILCCDAHNLLKKNFTVCFPEFASLLEKMQKELEIDYIDEEVILRHDQNKKILRVKVSKNVIQNQITNFIIALNDITEIITAQKSAAWADVARKVAHEIKNPLTPIHLAADRIKHKLSGSSLASDKDIVSYVETIMKHVANISNMVEEFSNFAKLPTPKFTNCDIASIVRDAVNLNKVANKRINYSFSFPKESILLNCDPYQITQALLNLLKNAETSVKDKYAVSQEKKCGIVKVTIESILKSCIITVSDDGKGIPKGLTIHHLIEPYFTTKKDGTGLGLPIVKKIVDDHGGLLEISGSDLGGLQVKISLPITESA